MKIRRSIANTINMTKRVNVLSVMNRVDETGKLVETSR
jgi:hypothetical protein